MEIPKKATPEEVAKWREENKDKLNPSHEFTTMPDGTVVDTTKENEDEVKEVFHEQRGDLK